MPRLDVQKVPTTEDRSLPVFAEFDRLADLIRLEAYNLFASRGAGDGHALDDWLAAEREVCRPAAKLVARDGAFALDVSLAGFEPDEITVTATPREVMIKAAHTRTQKSDEEGAEVCWSEFRSDNVFRRIELPAVVDVNKISANLKNGLLEIVAPKAESAPESAKKIRVSAAGAR